MHGFYAWVLNPLLTSPDNYKHHSIDGDYYNLWNLPLISPLIHF